MTTTRWTSADLPDLSGRTAVVTGGSSGLDTEAVRALAGAGARVVLAVRDTARGESVAATIEGDADVRPLDLADLASTGGSFIGPDRRMGTKRSPTHAELIPAATDPEVACGLWDLSARLTGVDDRSLVAA